MVVRYFAFLDLYPWPRIHVIQSTQVAVRAGIIHIRYPT